MEEAVPNVDQIITEIIQREGGFTNHPNDRGGRTIYGISERAHPEVWVNGPPSEAQARMIYHYIYVQVPKFDQIRDPSLQAQLVDYGVHSGPTLATMKLQHILGVEEDGVLGPITLGAVENVEPIWLNNRLMVERLKMVGRIVARDKSQAVWASGWLNRIVEFMR